MCRGKKVWRHLSAVLPPDSRCNKKVLKLCLTSRVQYCEKRPVKQQGFKLFGDISAHFANFSFTLRLDQLLGRGGSLVLQRCHPSGVNAAMPCVSRNVDRDLCFSERCASKVDGQESEPTRAGQSWNCSTSTSAIFLHFPCSLSGPYG